MAYHIQQPNGIDAYYENLDDAIRAAGVIFSETGIIVAIEER